MWPYSYDTCDLGTFISQQDKNGNPPSSDTLGTPTGTFSLLPGQKASACSCPGSDHPGPNVGSGRGVPEIDMYVFRSGCASFYSRKVLNYNQLPINSFEAQIEPVGWQGEVSQSFQIAPFNAEYQFDESGVQFLQPGAQKFNSYKGGTYQQAVSTVTNIPSTSYIGQGWGTYGFEFWGNKKDRGNTYITWYVNGVPSWTAKAAAVGADTTSKISARLISEEPMVSLIC